MRRTPAGCVFPDALRTALPPHPPPFTALPKPLPPHPLPPNAPQVRQSLVKDHTGAWQHVVACVDPQLLALYCNGRSGERRALSRALEGLALPATPQCTIGARPTDQGSPAQPLDAVVVGYVRAWADMATPTQATQLYLNCQAEAGGGGGGGGTGSAPALLVPGPLLDGDTATEAVGDAAPEDMALCDHVHATSIRLHPHRLVLQLLMQEGSGPDLHNAVPAAPDDACAAVRLSGDVEWVCCHLGYVSGAARERGRGEWA